MGEGGENTRHRVTGGAGSDRAGGGEAIFFSAHRLNWVVKLVWVMRVGALREQRNARDSQKDHRETSSPGGDTRRCRQNKHSLGPEQSMTGFIIIEIPELLDAQEESGDELRSAEEEPAGECAGTVTESGEHGNRKKTNAEDKKIR